MPTIYDGSAPKRVILSGIQPSGTLTLGNYLGALRNWVDIQDNFNCNFFIADLHSITVDQDPKVLRENIENVLKIYIACGINPEKNTIFLQSHVHEHAELGWILNNSTYMGELNRMTQFKDKSAKQQNISAGLFDYPVLMAADILLYDSDLVPVGEDQRQHLELTRDVAKRFNSKYGEIFKVPEGYISDTGARIMSLQDPEKKMSKSDSNKNAFISLLDSKDDIIKKISKAVTDSKNVVRYSDDQPGIQNLINIYSTSTGKTVEEVEKEFDGANYGTFKKAVAEVVADVLAKIQNEYAKLDDREYLKQIYTRGAQKATAQAQKKLAQVYEAVGFIVK